MIDLYPGAQWRPLSAQQSEPVIGVPKLLVIHTMVGNLRGTESMFREGGYSGVESSFGLGGAFDGSLDGVGYQWQRLSRQADAQMAANAFATSVECSDGGDFRRPFSGKQVAWLIDFTEWWCRNTGRPCVKATRWDGVGVGYHNMFLQWTGGPRDCPGAARTAQLENVIWPTVRARLGAKADVHSPVTPPLAHVAPRFPLREGDFYSRTNNAGMGAPEEGLRTWQSQMKARGWSIDADGRFGDGTQAVVHQFQREKGLGVDDKIGLQTWNAAWNAKVT
jgi:hypothetical protein